MVGAISRETYFETGLDVLADLGYGGLKLAEVCRRLGVTTGSFYHYFTSWSAFTRSLVEHWMQGRTDRSEEVVRTEPDPRRRLGSFIREAMVLPHGAEAAIRVWGSVDPYVHRAQAALDQQRFDLLLGAAADVLGNERQARVFASWAMYLLIGYEQFTLPRNPRDLRWIADQLLEALDSGRFGSVPDEG